MKIVTWNINGLRATIQNLKDLIKETDADVLCLQETKITKDLLTSDVALIDGYNSYFSFSQKRAGYSGVAIFCKNSVTPIKVQAGLSDIYEQDANTAIGCYGDLFSVFTKERIKELDTEGRTLITQHELNNTRNKYNKLIIINVYCPRAHCDDDERNDFKIDFYKALEERAKALLKTGNHVVVVGDINTSHRLIDHCDPSDPILFFDNKSRAWLDTFLFNDADYGKVETLEELEIDRGCFVDSFRYFYPNRRDTFTCWCTSSRARETNYGTRIDYIFTDALLAKQLKSCESLTDFQGSDHCPVEASLNVAVIPSKILPPLCSGFYPEFGGKQQTLSAFFSKRSEITNRKRPFPSPVKTKNKKKETKATQIKLTSLFTKINSEIQETRAIVASKLPVPQKSKLSTETPSNKEACVFWKKLLKGPEPMPLCSGHNEECVKRTVKKEGPNLGRHFYCCARPEGHKTNPEARCQFFKWC